MHLSEQVGYCPAPSRPERTELDVLLLFSTLLHLDQGASLKQHLAPFCCSLRAQEQDLVRSAIAGQARVPAFRVHQDQLHKLDYNYE